LKSVMTCAILKIADCDVHEKKTSLLNNCDPKNSEKSIACEGKNDQNHAGIEKEKYHTPTPKSHSTIK